MHLRPLLSILLFTTVGCGAPDAKPETPSGEAAPAASDPPPADEAATDFEGVWSLSHDALGSMKLEVRDGDWVITDVRGKRWELDVEEDEEDGVVQMTAEFETPKPGFKLLFNRPHTTLDAKGHYNFRKGGAQAIFQRRERDGQQVVFCQFFREADPVDTLRAVNLIREAPAPTPGE